MINWIKNLFKPRIKERKLNFSTLSVADMLDKHPNAIPQLLHKQVDGFHIQGFLNTESVQLILEKLAQIKQEKLSAIPNGKTYPMVFSAFANNVQQIPAQDQPQAAKAYFEEMADYNQHFDTNFSTDLKHQLTTFFSKLSGGWAIDTPPGPDEGGEYAFATARVLTKNGGNIDLHCGNIFQSHHQGFYTDLMRK